MKYYRETETKYAYSQGDQNCHMRQKVNIGAARLFSQFSFRKGKENWEGREAQRLFEYLKHMLVLFVWEDLWDLHL